MLEIIFSKSATDSLIEQAFYIYKNSKNIDMSDKYLDEMRDFIVSTLSSFPKAGRPSDELMLNSRKLVYKGYSIIYQIETERINILALYRENSITREQ